MKELLESRHPQSLEAYRRPEGTDFVLKLPRKKQTRVGLLGLLFFLAIACGCATIKVRGLAPAERAHYLRLKALIERLSHPDYTPSPGERLYPFTYVFYQSQRGKTIRKGRGFIAVRGPLWCLVRHWHDTNTGKPGRRILIVDRTQRRLEAEVRHWPRGNPRRRWNNWCCIRLLNGEADLYRCEYYFPEGTECLTRNGRQRGFYEAVLWNEDGLLAQITRFSNWYARYHYKGLKLTRIEFGRGDKVVTRADFFYNFYK